MTPVPPPTGCTLRRTDYCQPGVTQTGFIPTLLLDDLRSAFRNYDLDKAQRTAEEYIAVFEDPADPDYAAVRNELLRDPSRLVELYLIAAQIPLRRMRVDMTDREKSDLYNEALRKLARLEQMLSAVPTALQGQVRRRFEGDFRVRYLATRASARKGLALIARNPAQLSEALGNFREALVLIGRGQGDAYDRTEGRVLLLREIGELEIWQDDYTHGIEHLQGAERGIGGVERPIVRMIVQSDIELLLGQAHILQALRSSGRLRMEEALGALENGFNFLERATASNTQALTALNTAAGNAILIQKLRAQAAQIGLFTRLWLGKAFTGSPAFVHSEHGRQLIAERANRIIPRGATEPEFNFQTLAQRTEQIRLLRLTDSLLLAPLAPDPLVRLLDTELIAVRAEASAHLAILNREMGQNSEYIARLRQALTQFRMVIDDSRSLRDSIHRARIWKAKLLAMAAEDLSVQSVRDLLQAEFPGQTVTGKDSVYNLIDTQILAHLEGQVVQSDLIEEVRFLRAQMLAFRALVAKDQNHMADFRTHAEEALRKLQPDFPLPVLQMQASLLRAQLAATAADEIENAEAQAVISQVLGGSPPMNRQGVLEAISSRFLEPLATPTRDTFLEDPVDLARAENLALRAFEEKVAAPTGPDFLRHWGQAMDLLAPLVARENIYTQGSARLWVAKLSLFALGYLHQSDIQQKIVQTIGLTLPPGGNLYDAEFQILNHLEQNFVPPAERVLQEKALEEARQVHGELLLQLARHQRNGGHPTVAAGMRDRAETLLTSAAANGWKSTQLFAHLVLGQLATETAGETDQPDAEQLRSLEVAERDHFAIALNRLARAEQQPFIQIALVRNLYARTLLMQIHHQPYQNVLDRFEQMVRTLRNHPDPRIQAEARLAQASLVSVLMSEIDDPTALGFVERSTSVTAPPVVTQPNMYRDHPGTVDWQLRVLDQAEAWIREAEDRLPGPTNYDARKQHAELHVAQVQLLLAGRNVPRALQKANDALTLLGELERTARHARDRAEISASKASLIAALLNENEGRDRAQQILGIPAGTESERERDTFSAAAHLLDQALATGFMTGELGRWYRLLSAELWTRVLAARLDYEGPASLATQEALGKIRDRIREVGDRGSPTLKRRKVLLQGRVLLLTAEGNPARLREAADQLERGFRQGHFDRYTAADILLRIGQAYLQLSYTTHLGTEAERALEFLNRALPIVQGGAPPTDSMKLLESEILITRGETHIARHEFENAASNFEHARNLLGHLRSTEWTHLLEANATRGSAEVERYHRFEFADALETYRGASTQIAGSPRRSALPLLARIYFGEAEIHRAAWTGGRNFHEAERMYNRALELLHDVQPPTREIEDLRDQIRVGLEKSQLESSASLDTFVVSGSQRTALGLELTIPVTNRMKLYFTEQVAAPGTHLDQDRLNVASAGAEWILGGREHGSLSVRVDPLRFAGTQWMPSVTSYADYHEIVSWLLSMNPPRDFSDPRELKLQSTIFWRPLMMGNTRSYVGLRDIALGAEATYLPGQNFAFFSGVLGYALRPFDSEWEGGVELRVPAALAPHFPSTEDAQTHLPWRTTARVRWNPTWLPVAFELQGDASYTASRPSGQVTFDVRFERLFSSQH